jgi:hypothetical protein
MVIASVADATQLPTDIPVVLPVADSESTTPPLSVEQQTTTASTPAVEPSAVKEKQSNMQLDLAFCCDCTGSMASYIRQAQENIRKIAAEVAGATAAQIQFALVTYRDHPPQDSTYVTQTHAFTPSLATMQEYVNTMSAAGGGDGPEAVADGLYEILKLSWRPNSTKVCVLISDAPPHGLGEIGDGFPNGCPDGHDPIQICRQLETMGVIVYAVGVEPTLSQSYKFARDFMMSVAKITNGKYLPLGKAELLAKVIVGGCMEGLIMDGVWEEVEKELQKAQAESGGKCTEAEVAEKVKGHLKGKVSCWKVETDCPYGDSYDAFNMDRFSEAAGLCEAKSKLDAHRNVAASAKVSSYHWGEQKCESAYDDMSTEQVSRVATKKGFFKSKA